MYRFLLLRVLNVTILPLRPLSKLVSLKARLIQQRPRDLSGSRSSDRFVFQQTWALCTLLLLHKHNTDYVVVFDYHDDVVILDAEQNPSTVEAFQVKTSTSNWTVKSLVKREAGKGSPPNLLPSIAGKLYDLKKRLPDDVKLLQFVSNMPVSVKLKKDGKTYRGELHTLFADLDETDATLLKEALKAELCLPGFPELDGVLEFAVTDIPVREHATYGAGRLAEFLNEHFPGKQFSTVPIYKALLSEVALRNNNQHAIASFEELIRHKSISRSTFSSILDTLGITATQITWDEVGERLNSEGYPVTAWSSMKRHWDVAVLDRLTRRDLQYTQMSTLIERACRSLSVSSLSAAVEGVYNEIKPRVKEEWNFTDGYLRSAIALEIYEPSKYEDAGTGFEEGSE